jgi:hypothetical protein
VITGMCHHVWLSMIHLELFFAGNVRGDQCSSFCRNSQFFQPHLFKKNSLSPWNDLLLSQYNF